jgi:hypothetical protein
MVVKGEERNKCLYHHRPLITAKSSLSWTLYPLSASFNI